jgi:hypothetical protein
MRACFCAPIGMYFNAICDESHICPHIVWRHAFAICLVEWSVSRAGEPQ